MNYLVHAIMYFYYGLTALRIHPPWAPLVTTLQIGQMFVGMFLCAAVWLFSAQGRDCDVSPDNYRAGLAMYASYAALFVAFAGERYLGWGSAQRSGPGAAAKQQRAAAAAAAADTPTSASSTGIGSELHALRRRAGAH